MKNYIAVKAIKARPMTENTWKSLLPKAISSSELKVIDPDGYLVEYPDGYQSWSPKEAFDLSHLEIDDPTKISENDIDRFMGANAYTASQLDEKTTMVKLTPRTGFTQYEVSSCVDPDNYDHTMGIDICVKRIRNTIWPMLGFVLQWANYGLKPIK